MSNELSFLKHAISQSERNNKRKAKPKLLTWDSLPNHFLTQTKKPNKRNFFQTVLSKSNPDFPYEVRLKYQNANVPFGTDGNEGNMNENGQSVPTNNTNPNSLFFFDIGQENF